jgi:hypothetical protein
MGPRTPDNRLEPTSDDRETATYSLSHIDLEAEIICAEK